MASLGHVAVGIAAARIDRDSSTKGSLGASMVVWSLLSLCPDLDVIGFAFGIRYADPWGHRGATHSMGFALAVGLLLALGARLAGARALRTALLGSLVVASHALLDTLTDGGLGCALFWPFDDTRYFAPYRPIPVAPIGLGYLSCRAPAPAWRRPNSSCLRRCFSMRSGLAGVLLSESGRMGALSGFQR